MILTLLTGHTLLPRSSQLGYICLQPGHKANSCWLVRQGPSSQVLKQNLKKFEYFTIPTVNLTTEMWCRSKKTELPRIPKNFS